MWLWCSAGVPTLRVPPPYVTERAEPPPSRASGSAHPSYSSTKWVEAPVLPHCPLQGQCWGPGDVGWPALGGAMGGGGSGGPGDVGGCVPWRCPAEGCAGGCVVLLVPAWVAV